MYLDGLDKLDQKIIQLLIENARISYSDIGEEIEISRVAVKARIQALEKKGVIEEYTTIINPQKISGAVSCYFEIETKPEHLPQVTNLMKWSSFCTMSLILCLVLSAAAAIQSYHVLKILKGYAYRICKKRHSPAYCGRFLEVKSIAVTRPCCPYYKSCRGELPILIIKLYVF